MIMSSQNNIYELLLSSRRSVFTIQSLRMLTGIQDERKLPASLHYFVKTGKIRNPRRGIYTKKEYDEREMACSLFRPSYISLEYVLQRAGIVFQYDSTITSVSYLNRRIEVDGKEYAYRIIKPQLWVGMEGIWQQDNVCIASPERAFLDLLYLSAGNCFFDKLNPLNVKKVKELLPLYNSLALIERASKLLDITTI